jgi:hypothetical protein
MFISSSFEKIASKLTESTKTILKRNKFMVNEEDFRLHLILIMKLNYKR